MKTKRTRKWHEKLSLEEIRHVNEWCGGTLAGLKRARLQQEKDLIIARRDNPNAQEPCWECKTIARVLGLGD